MEPVQKSSFHPGPIEHPSINHNLIDQECLRIINAKEAIEIADRAEGQARLPVLLKLILGFYNTLLHKFDNSKGDFPDLCFNSSFNIKISLFKLMLAAIQKKLFISPQFQKDYEEISFSLTFKSTLAPLLISIVSENTNLIPMERLISFYKTLTSEQYLLYMPIHLYYLYGGSLFTIQAKIFKQKIVHIIEALSKALSNSDTVISRNIEFYKSQRERKIILEESVKVVMLAKSKDSLNEMAVAITNSIFSGKEYLNKEQFLHQIQSKPSDSILTIFMLLLRAQFTLFEEKTFQNHVSSRSEAINTNFYASQMTKLFNKCPFNGDERCNCKKCQCVRRNRESAKLNQQKKRNAVEQVQQMKRRLDELQEQDRIKTKKIIDLQEQNMMLKTLLKQIKLNPTMKSIMRETIEPISKVLDNQL